MDIKPQTVTIKKSLVIKILAIKYATNDKIIIKILNVQIFGVISICLNSNLTLV